MPPGEDVERRDLLLIRADKQQEQRRRGTLQPLAATMMAGGPVVDGGPVVCQANFDGL